MDFEAFTIGKLEGGKLGEEREEASFSGEGDPVKAWQDLQGWLIEQEIEDVGYSSSVDSLVFACKDLSFKIRDFEHNGLLYELRMLIMN